MESPVIWDAATVMWCDCNDVSPCILGCCTSVCTFVYPAIQVFLVFLTCSVVDESNILQPYRISQNEFSVNSQMIMINFDNPHNNMLSPLIYQECWTRSRRSMSANIRIRFGLQIILVCLYSTLSHYHHCANLSEGIEIIKCLSDTFCWVCE